MLQPSFTREDAMEIRELATGLEFPEGPTALPNGDVLVVEIQGERVSRIASDGARQRVAETGGGPNGAALGPGGRLYVCNNGGFEWHRFGDLTVPGEQPADYSGGRIECIDLETGKVEVLYRECAGHDLRGPNDLVFDRDGGFWFTDHGKVRARERDRGGVYYALPDGSRIEEVLWGLDAPNGVALSPDGDRLYVAETWTGRVWFWEIEAPGRVRRTHGGLGPAGGTLLAGLPGFQLLDSMAVDAAGHVCVATIGNGGITVIAPDGAVVEHVPLPDPLTTNLCFGGPDLRTVYATLSGTGRLVTLPWPRPGLRLAF